MKNKKTRNIQLQKIDYLNRSLLSQNDILLEYNTSLLGYNSEQVESQRKKFGYNEITQIKGDSLLKRLFDAYINPFTVVLIILAIISYITDVMLASTGQADYTAVIIVVLMVVISGTLRFVQETRSNKSAEKLSALVTTTTAIIRQPEGLQEIALKQVVIGDIIQLAAGDMIPADMRILQAKDLFISQSALTGESEPVEKTASHTTNDNKSYLDIENIAFMGSTVISGTAQAIVIATGDSTLFGSIAQSINDKAEITSFEVGVNSVSWLLIRFMMFMVPFVLFVNGFTKGDWIEAFLFAVSIAVGLTPEMLPMIVTTNLAKGAVKMSKEQTVVKNISAIQNFGAMDVLCTDKTGTLTQDKVVLEYHLNLHGQEDNRVLRHAFINSYYQTGLKNLMDEAILAHASDQNMKDLMENYTKVDEIPFDFTRRRMSVVVSDHNNKTQLITKGAVEEMLSISSFVEYEGKVLPITQAIKTEILAVMQSLNEKGMRVIAIAQKTNPANVDIFSIEDESNMVLMGYLAFLDPPKDSAQLAIQTLLEYGVHIKVLTGDNDAITRTICSQVGLEVDNLLLGSDIDLLDDQQLSISVETTNVFAKLSPPQKVRIVSALKNNSHTVGFLGDGINDAAAMKKADVGISVDTAVDIAKESADIILLKKDLMVLERGVVEGRKTFANIIKYIKMTASSNFGNMFSVLIASALLPFLPMLPIQLLALNLIYDISCISLPWDNVDEEYLKVPRKWDASSIKSFMLWIGPTSSIFDLIAFIVLFFVIAPSVVNGYYHDTGVDQAHFMAIFNAGWFTVSLWTQTLVIHMIRTAKIPFIQSRTSFIVSLMTCLAIFIGTILPFTSLGAQLYMAPLPLNFYYWLLGIIVSYMLLISLIKKIYINKYKELL